MPERRKHERTRSRLRCWCEAGDITLFSKVGNLSEGGMFLQTNTPMALGERTRLRLRCADQREVRTEAVVVWSREQRENERPAGMGLRFEGMAPEALEHLRRVIVEEQRLVALGM
jgi:uncharacterized protein (TIGR02266 family)